MINNQLKAALVAMGVVCQDDELSKVVDVLEEAIVNCREVR